MHYNMLFQVINLKKFLGRSTAPPQTPPHWGSEKPSSDPTPSAPTAPRSSRLRRSTPRVFGARFYSSRIFNADCRQS